MRLSHFLLFCLVLSFAGHTIGGQDKTLLVSEKFLPTLGRAKAVSILSPGKYDSHNNLRWYTRIDHDSPTSFLRIHIRVNQIPQNPHWSLQILDENNSDVQALEAANFSDRSHYLEAW